MAEFPYMPLWTDAYLADTTHLNTLENGAYLLLLMAMWRTASKSLPNDDRKLAKFSRLGPRQWQRIKPTMMAFFTVDGDQITQKRLLAESVAVRRRLQMASDNAKARWLKNKETSHADAMRDGCYHTHTRKESKNLTPPSSSESSILQKKTPSRGGNGEDRGKRLTEDWEPSEKAIAYCRTELGCTEGLLDREYEMFRDWALSATGPASRKRSWDRAFVNWIRRVTNELRQQEERERRWAERRARPH